MRIRYRGMFLALAALFTFGYPSQVSASQTPFIPYSAVGDYWISADGRTPIKGALERGITVTKYQNSTETIDWPKVKAADISFAMVRLGYMDDLDPYFEENMISADRVGIKTGVCFYGKAVTEEEARKEAEYVLEKVRDFRVSFPISYDVNTETVNGAKLKKEETTAIVNAFCKVIEDAGFKAVVYGDYDWLTKNIDTSEMPYGIWYDRNGVANSFPGRTLWRCMNSAKINGIKGGVCLEFSFEDYETTFPGTGWRTIKNRKYYFKDYRMVKDTVIQIEDRMYRFDEKGRAKLIRN